MKTSKHTPGPWNVCTPPSFSEAYRHITKEGDFSVICSIDGRDTGTNAEKNANAHLIAAAPELFEALRWAESCLVPYVYAQSADERAHAFKDAAHALDRMREAITKAEGRA